MEKHREKIEQLSVAMEGLGLTPVAARTYIYLLLCKDSQATFEQIVEYFGVSKSAVSNAIKMLESTKMITSKTVGGQRKRYFSANLAGIFNEQTMTDRIRVFFGILDEIRSIRHTDDTLNEELEAVALLYKMMLVELPLILERWKRTVALNKAHP
ncbi:GbsR/MarR family transcriptional regulator [Chitinophaga eiseniae]|uniref:Winged helix-turn-helix transcriptional regulator n=1 Tax=Chitinophaga eiseniae TaxID=634771 RepID=A0A847SEA8_9BACT|nr:winged helix-turn-helix domain-containing protein [Chitinophaga eiseniae]NLR77177.1 winged helix-turn-helix transcriptional regulator [Chitinophaga eiseniae]